MFLIESFEETRNFIKMEKFSCLMLNKLFKERNKTFLTKINNLRFELICVAFRNKTLCINIPGVTRVYCVPRTKRRAKGRDPITGIYIILRIQIHILAGCKFAKSIFHSWLVYLMCVRYHDEYGVKDWMPLRISVTPSVIVTQSD